jgi:hypothetical protein
MSKEIGRRRRGRRASLAARDGMEWKWMRWKCRDKRKQLDARLA